MTHASPDHSQLVEVLRQIGPHNHLCLIYETQGEQFAAALTFLQIGLERGERCLYIVDENTANAVLEAMRARGMDVDSALRVGALIITSKQETYLKPGHFDPDEMIRFLTEATDEAKAAGFDALRVTAEMTWQLGDGSLAGSSSVLGGERLMEYEAKLNYFFHDHDASAICQYNRNRFAPEIIRDVIRTHPIVICGGWVCQNPYYVPPEEFLKHGQDALEVERLLHNIQEREWEQKAVRESEARFRRLAENAQDIVYRYRLVPAPGFEYVSPAATTIIGYTPEEHYADPYLGVKIIHPDDRSLLEAAFRGERPPDTPLTLRWIRKDGTMIWTEQRNVPFYDQAGNLIAIEGIARDITRRKQAEKELSERSRLLEAFFANALTCIVLLDRNFNFIRVNEAYARACARDLPEFPGHNHFEFYPSNAQPIFEEVVRTKKPFQTFARPFVFPDHPEWGTIYWDWTLVPILDSAGEVEFLVFTLNDVSERVRAEGALREREEYLTHLMNTMGDAVFTVKYPERQIEFANQAIANIFGYAPEEVIGQMTRMLYADDSDFLRYIELAKAILAQGKNQLRIEMQMARKDGSRFWAEVHSTILFVHDQPSKVISVARDVTAQRQARDERERLFEEVRAGRKRLESLSHHLVEMQEAERRHIALELHDEIGQALTGLRLSLELSPQLPANIAATRLAEAKMIVEDIIRRVESLSLDLRPPILDDLGLLPTLLWYFDRYSTRSGVRVECKHTGFNQRFPPAMELAVFRIVQESLTNVARHAHVNEVSVRVWATPRVLGVQVEDRGVGFDAERALSAGETSGVSGMRERVRLLGGQLDIESAAASGTRLTVELPLEDVLERREQPR